MLVVGSPCQAMVASGCSGAEALCQPDLVQGLQHVTQDACTPEACFCLSLPIKSEL